MDWNNLIPEQNDRNGFSIFHSTLKSEDNKAFPIVKKRRRNTVIVSPGLQIALKRV